MPYVPQRDLIGYGSTPPAPRWPDTARLAVNFVLNYEEGAEYNVLEGDAHSEILLSDTVRTRAPRWHAGPEYRVCLRVRQPCRCMALPAGVR